MILESPVASEKIYEHSATGINIEFPGDFHWLNIYIKNNNFYNFENETLMLRIPVIQDRMHRFFTLCRGRCDRFDSPGAMPLERAQASL